MQRKDISCHIISAAGFPIDKNVCIKYKYTEIKFEEHRSITGIPKWFMRTIWKKN